jgi:hypothetical protein
LQRCPGDPTAIPEHACVGQSVAAIVEVAWEVNVNGLPPARWRHRIHPELPPSYREQLTATIRAEIARLIEEGYPLDNPELRGWESD